MRVRRSLVCSALLTAALHPLALASESAGPAAAPARSGTALADFTVTVGTVTVAPGATVSVPLTLDHSIAGLSVYSIQYSLNHSAAYVTAASVAATGLMAVWGQPFSNSQSGKITVANGGSQALGAGTNLHNVSITVSPSAPPGTDVPLTLTGFLANEGAPSATVVGGVLQIRSSTDAPLVGQDRLGLAPRPNPAWQSAGIDYSLPASVGSLDRVRLAIYGLNGGRVRQIVNGPVGPGAHHAVWDGRDERGAPQPAGLYFVRLDCRDLHCERKLVLAR